MKKFEWVDHPSDIGFRAYGKSLEKAFENAALALTEIMADADKVKPEGEISIELQAEDREALLFDWLDFFLYLQDAEDLISSKFEVESITEENEGFKLKARAWGEKYDPDRHGAGTEVKAVTYHMMEIECGPDRFSVQVVVDI
ncbi:hypothetical protein AKJ41_02820 [candidate division MSBL1 archaeon SCGC-AAA259O05]|uniref:Protein archease n=1 Tax=candidate division MSBL1 archaeon SCGC-AAA259O05 TaxID=1698271 RepID=A0A133V3P8_9EURY|nr:hypothetical protein AKJ41_02820 [candidate division MSBL1 archaeon SCGC-AAA259O05]